MKMPEKINDVMIAPCGMNCMVCYRHLKTKSPCMGCLNSDLNKPEHCRSCNIKECIKEKGIDYCFNCTSFPCKIIKGLDKSYKKRYTVSLIENSIKQREHGISNFLQKDRITWTCSTCGGAISLHDKECSECKKKY